MSEYEDTDPFDLWQRDIDVLQREVAELRERLAHAEAERDRLLQERELKPGQHVCICCNGSGITRDPKPGEMVDI